MNSNLKYPPENRPRAPNEAELRQLWEWLKLMGHDVNYCLAEENWFCGFYIAVFDHYCTGSPGYVGKILYLIWDGTMDACDIFGWKGADMFHCAQHSDVCGSDYGE